jgi:hypothetical protein
MKSCSVYPCKQGFEVIPSHSHWNSRKDKVTEESCCQAIYEDVTELFKRHEDGDGLVNVKDADGTEHHKKCCCGEKESSKCKLVKAVESKGFKIMGDPNGCGALVGAGWHNYQHEKIKSKACKITQLEAEELSKTIVAPAMAEEL